MSKGYLGILQSLHRAPPTRIFGAANVSILLTGTVPGIVTGQTLTLTCPGIHVTILDIRNGNGTVDCALFDGPKGSRWMSCAQR